MYELPVDLPQFPMEPSRSLFFIWCAFLLGKFDPLKLVKVCVAVLRLHMCCEEMGIDINTSTHPPRFLVAQPNQAKCET
jgi:hypothetical protein